MGLIPVNQVKFTMQTHIEDGLISQVKFTIWHSHVSNIRGFYEVKAQSTSLFTRVAKTRLLHGRSFINSTIIQYIKSRRCAQTKGDCSNWNNKRRYYFANRIPVEFLNIISIELSRLKINSQRCGG